MSKEIVVNERMAKRIRASRYEQDRKGQCLICRVYYPDCPHTWAEVFKVCQILKEHDLESPKVRLAL